MKEDYQGYQTHLKNFFPYLFLHGNKREVIIGHLYCQGSCENIYENCPHAKDCQQLYLWFWNMMKLGQNLQDWLLLLLFISLYLGESSQNTAEYLPLFLF